MENSLIINFILENLSLLISAVISAAFLLVNIILAIKNKDKNKLKEALLYLPEVINQIESLSKLKSIDGLQKKAMVEAILNSKFGSLYRKNYQLFDDAIEDILNTPQKKGGTEDVSKEGQSKKG